MTTRRAIDLIQSGDDFNKLASVSSRAALSAANKGSSLGP
jgi:hypothetical protein